MSSYPPVTVLIITYNRPHEVREVIEALQAKLSYPGELRWQIADDSTPDPLYVPEILRDFSDLNFTHTITHGRSGWGVNCNTGLRKMTTKYVFQCEDDQVAQRTIDLDTGVFVMEHMDEVGLVRYDGIEGHKLVLLLRETPRVEGRREHFLQIERELTRKMRRELYGYSHRPHLKHMRFHAVLGAYPEGYALGSTEQLFAWRAMMNDGPPEIITLADGVTRAFKHIGKSRQGMKEDIGQVVNERGV